jgi:ribosome-associated toxin RatA of RatAB toxin-antitoxin module
MPDYNATHTIQIDAPPQACYDVLTDYGAMSQWNGPLKEAKVLSSDKSGAGTEVEYAIDVKLRTVHYVLEHTYDPPRSIGSRYVRGDFKDFSGEYQFAEQDGGTCVTFHLNIDPGMRIPGKINKMLNEAVMEKALRDLKKRVESLRDGA